MAKLFFFTLFISGQLFGQAGQRNAEKSLRGGGSFGKAPEGTKLPPQPEIDQPLQLPGMPAVIPRRYPDTPVTGMWAKIKGNRSLIREPQILTMYSRCRGEAIGKAKKPEGGGEPTSEAIEEHVDICMKKEIEKMPGPQAKILAQKLGLDLDTQRSFTYRSNPAYKLLEEYLSERLRESLVGEIDLKRGKKGKLVDHKTFYDLYQTQLGKNIVTTMTSFCIEATEDLLIHKDPKKRAEVRKINLKNLGERVTNNDNTGVTGVPNPAMQIKGYTHFQSCISRMIHICAQTKYTFDGDDGQPVTLDYSKEEVFKGNSLDATIKDDIEYTRQRSCLAVRELRKIRKNLLNIGKIQHRLKKSKGEANNPRHQFRGTFGFDGIYGKTKNPGEKNIGDLTTLTSNEFMNRSGTGYRLRMDGAIFERECKTNLTPRCLKMLNTNADWAKFVQNSAEFDAETQLNKAAILGMTPQEYRIFLENEGRTMAEINMIMQNIQKEKDSQGLVKKIAQQYENERNAVKLQMAEAIKSTNPYMGHKKPYTQAGVDVPGNQEESKQLRETLALQLAEKPDIARDTLHYSNIVSAFFMRSSSGGKLAANSAPAVAELDDSALDPRYARMTPAMLNPNKKSMMKDMAGVPVVIPTIEPMYFQKLRGTTSPLVARQPNKDNSKPSSHSTFEPETLNAFILKIGDSDTDSRRIIRQLELARKAGNKGGKKSNNPPPSQDPPPLNNGFEAAPALQN